MSERRFSQGDAFRSALPVIVAHRGASATHPENTVEAFGAAVDAGADAMEFDVRVTADGHPVVLHDALVDRTTDGHGAVRSKSLDDVRRLRIATEGGAAAGVPTLAEVLAFASGRIGVDIEIKNIPGEPDFDADRERAVDATIEALDAAAFVGPVLLSSFNPLSLAWVRERAPGITTGLLTPPEVEADVALGFARDEGHPWVLPATAMVRAAGTGFADRAHADGLSVGTWIVDDPEEAVDLMRTGIDAVATNDPAALVRARDRAFGS